MYSMSPAKRMFVAALPILMLAAILALIVYVNMTPY